MRAVIQRVTSGSVKVDGKIVGAIGKGVVILLGVGRDDTPEDARYLAEKTANLRIFEDERGLMNQTLLDTGGSALVVSQFTLYGDCRKGRRPSFSHAAPPDEALRLYELFTAEISRLGVPTATGVFQAHMEVHLVNDGPVTLLLDSSRLF